MAGAPPTLTREEYFEERKLLIEARSRSYQQVEQMITGGAAGALVLSITFLEKLVTGRTIRESESLIAAWILLMLTLVVRLFGQYASAKSFDCEMASLNARAHNRPEPRNNWAVAITACGAIGGLLFIAGMVVLARFAYVNAPFYQAGS